MVSRAVAASSLARFSMQAFAIGKDTLLQGEYRLLETIGGTTSRVYLAKRAQARGTDAEGLVVARLWKPSPELLHEERAQALFERALDQMRAATLLRHPVLAMVETCGGLDDGTLFMISEHAEGTPLDAFVDQAGIPPLPSVIDLAYRICSGLNAAHRNGLAHAALHPRSLIVRPHDESGALARLQAKLIDFGAPTCMFASPPSLHAARFMAPEQLELALKPAIDRSEPTVRMNIYGCGALLYYLCTGGPPLPGQSVQELLVAHAAHKVLPPSRINPQVLPALDAIIMKALDPQPRARFANAAELANALISIRFERSSSGVRHRAVGDERLPRDRRVTASAREDVTNVVDTNAMFEESPTSKTKRPQGPPPLPRGPSKSEPAFPSERPTAEVNIPLPSPPPLPRITPLPPSVPPSMPPVAADEITAETPLPTQAELAQEQLALAPREPEERPPAVLARPARRSIAPMHELFGGVPPALVIAVAALISLSIIYMVISRPSANEPTIEVTPLPPMPAAPQAPPPPPATEAAAGATMTEQLVATREPEKTEAPAREPRNRRSSRAAEPAPVRTPPSPDAASAHDAMVLRPQLDAPPEPETKPVPAPEPAPEQAPKVDAVVEAKPPAPAVARSPITPLPEPVRVPVQKPIAPLPEKATPRISNVEVKGSLATSQVRRGLDRIKGALEGCYRTALAARPSSLGELNVEVVFDERGRARSARATGAAPKALQECVESAAKRASVPPPDTGTVTATWKVSL